MKNNKKYIMCVDDADANLLLYKMLLKSIEDFTILYAKNGNEACDVYMEYKNDINIILMDYQMPILYGDDTLILLRNLGYKGLCFLITASQEAYSDIDSFKNNLKCEFDHIALKPIFKNDLFRLLKI